MQLHSNSITARKAEGFKVDAFITLIHSTDVQAVGEDSLEVKSKGRSWILRGEGREDRNSWIRSITAITESIPLVTEDFAHIKATDCVPNCLKSGMVQIKRPGKSVFKPAFLVIADHLYVFEGGYAEKPIFVAVLSPSCAVFESDYSENVFTFATRAAVVDIKVPEGSASAWKACLLKAIPEYDGGKARSGSHSNVPGIVQDLTMTEKLLEGLDSMCGGDYNHAEVPAMVSASSSGTSSGCSKITAKARREREARKNKALESEYSEKEAREEAEAKDREEAARAREEAAKTREESEAQAREEAARAREEAASAREEAARAREEAACARECRAAVHEDKAREKEARKKEAREMKAREKEARDKKDREDAEAKDRERAAKDRAKAAKAREKAAKAREKKAHKMKKKAEKTEKKMLKDDARSRKSALKDEARRRKSAQKCAIEIEIPREIAIGGERRARKAAQEEEDFTNYSRGNVSFSYSIDDDDGTNSESSSKKENDETNANELIPVAGTGLCLGLLLL